MNMRRRLLENFERGQARNEKFTFKEAMRIFEALHKEALALGALKKKDRLWGIEKDIRIAKALNALA